MRSSPRPSVRRSHLPRLMSFSSAAAFFSTTRVSAAAAEGRARRAVRPATGANRQVGDHSRGTRDAGQRAVGLVVAAEVGDVETEQHRRHNPDEYGDRRTDTDPPEPGLLHVGRCVVKDRDDQDDEEQDQWPPHDIPHRRRHLTGPDGITGSRSHRPAHREHERHRGGHHQTRPASAAAEAGAASKSGGPRRFRRSGSSLGRTRRCIPMPTTTRRLRRRSAQNRPRAYRRAAGWSDAACPPRTRAPRPRAISITASVVRRPWPKTPSSDTITRSAGNSDSTA